MTQQTMAGPSAKRVGPPEVAPVNVGNVKIEAIHWGKDRGLGQNGGYIAAFDRESCRPGTNQDFPPDIFA